MSRRSPLAQRVEHDLTLHPPTSEAIGKRMDILRAQAKKFAHAVVAQCPEKREQSLALTKIEEALFWAIAGIARYQDEDAG